MSMIAIHSDGVERSVLPSPAHDVEAEKTSRHEVLKVSNPVGEKMRRFKADCLISAVRTILVAAGLCVMPAAALAIPAITFDEATGAPANNQNQSVGWQFNVESAISVTGLGWFDSQADGLGRARTVGIWDPAGNLLTSVLVPDGATAPLDGQYRMVAIAPIVLDVGDGYIVGGQNFSDSGDLLMNNVDQVVDPRIEFVDATYSGFGGFMRPANFSVGGFNGFYGPMFALTSVPNSLPEPASLALLSLGMAVLAGRRKKARVNVD